MDHQKNAYFQNDVRYEVRFADGFSLRGIWSLGQFHSRDLYTFASTEFKTAVLIDTMACVFIAFVPIFLIVVIAIESAVKYSFV